MVKKFFKQTKILLHCPPLFSLKFTLSLIMFMYLNVFLCISTSLSTFLYTSTPLIAYLYFSLSLYVHLYHFISASSNFWTLKSLCISTFHDYHYIPFCISFLPLFIFISLSTSLISRDESQAS